MIALKIVLIVLIVITSLFLVLTILMHKGRGGGLSDMFGGGITQTAQSSGVAERNLNRITIVSLVIWVVCIVCYALFMRFDWLESDAQSDSESGQSSTSIVVDDSSSEDTTSDDTTSENTTSEESSDTDSTSDTTTEESSSEE